MNSKKILVTRSSMPDLSEYINEIAELFETHWLTNMGVKHQELQKQLENRMGVSNVSLFVNGHAALEVVIEAMELEGEVITTPFTFASTTHAIVRKGLHPVFCDIKPEDCTIDPAKIEALITSKTCAIMPVHVYGQICDTAAIKKIADNYNLKVIYDAAHAFGEKVSGVDVGNFGDASMFSFHATKVFNTIEGGAITTNDNDLANKMSLWRNFGLNASSDAEYPGGNSKMNEFAAAMGLCNLRRLAGEIAKRQQVYNRYMSILQNIPGIKVFPTQKNVESNYAYFPVLFDESVLGFSRDDALNELSKHGIGARKYFYPLTSDFKCFANQYDSSQTPIAKQTSERILTLSMYADLNLDDVERICEIILNLVKRCR